MLRAVVFDLDDTLAVTDRDRAQLLEEATATADAPSISRSAYVETHREHLTTDSRTPIFAALLEERARQEHETDDGSPEKTETTGSELAVDPEVLAMAYHEAITDALTPVPGVETMLERLGDTYRIGLLTNGPVRAQREKLAALGWESTFDVALVTGELEAGKPDDRAFAAVLAELDVTADEAVYVGDDVDADVGGATAAGIRAIHVLGPDTEPDSQAVAHVERDALATELPEILTGLADHSPESDG